MTDRKIIESTIYFALSSLRDEIGTFPNIEVHLQAI